MNTLMELYLIQNKKRINLMKTLTDDQDEMCME